MRFKKLIMDLDEQLDQIEKQNIEITQKVKLSITSCEKVLNKMNNFVTSTSFKSEQSEMEFFKETKIIPFSKLIYYCEILTFEIHYPKVSKEKQIRYIEERIEKINKFYDCNVEFIQYVKEDKTHFDKIYYTRNKNESYNFTNAQMYYRSSQFSTTHDILLAKLKGYDMLLDYLQDKLYKMQNLIIPNSNSFLEGNLHWTSSKVDLTELIYAIYSSRVINNGAIKIKEIASAFEHIFNIDLGDYYHTFTEIRARKSNVTKFVEGLNDSLIDFIQKFDE